MSARPTAPLPPPAPPPAAARAIGGFVARFVGGWIVAIALVSYVPALERWAVSNTIASLHGLARLLRLSVTATDTHLLIAGAGMEIVPDCTPLMPVAALAIAVFAFPAPWRWRAIGIAAGAVLLWVYNLLRILALVPVLRYRPEWFEFIHVYLWQTLTLIVVFVLFLVWLRLQGRAGTPAPAPVPVARPAAAPTAAP